MQKKILVLSALFIFMISLAGCATGRKQKDLEIQGLKNQIVVLQTESQAKDEEINSLKESLSRQSPMPEEQIATKPVVTKKRVVVEVKSRPKAKQIQMALTNAGFDPGPADGRMGRKTIEAIKAFQRSHGLAADGRVGKKTWNLLRGFLYQKLK